jgi:hypothetical protein
MTRIKLTPEERREPAKERRRRRRFLCVDCRKDTIDEYFMVSDELWAKSGLGPNDGMLCLSCFERRANHLLTARDFTAVFPRSWPEHIATRSKTCPDPN